MSIPNENQQNALVSAYNALYEIACINRQGVFLAHDDEQTFHKAKTLALELWEEARKVDTQPAKINTAHDHAVVTTILHSLEDKKRMEGL